VISSFCRELDQNCALQGYYAERSGNSSPTFRDNLRSHIVKNLILRSWKWDW